MADEIETYGQIEKPSFSQSLGSHLIDFIQTLVVFGAIFATLYLFVAQPHKVSGSSMFPTFKDGDYILTDKMSYRFGNPGRGDVVVLKNPANESQDFIKRVIALPGDTVEIEEPSVYINGQKLNEAYLPAGTITRGRAFLREGESVKVGPDQYFVFGDNRENSSDSRTWGSVTKEGIIGKVFFRYWPMQSFGKI